MGIAPMRFKPSAASSFSLFTKHNNPLLSFSLFQVNSFMASSSTSQTLALSSLPSEDSAAAAAADDDRLCFDTTTQLSLSNLHIRQQLEQQEEDQISSGLGGPTRCLSGESRIERAWAHWKKVGEPKLIVAPMVDNSELPFRMLCRKYGAEAAYTPMLHSRIFTENEKYRSQEFTTCKFPD